MASSQVASVTNSARLLTLAAHAAFLPIGVVTVLLSPLLPTLSVRWSLNYSQAGALFTAQFLASTIGVSISGFLVARWGFRSAINAGLLVIAASLALLLRGSRLLGIACIAGYGAGLGFAVPAANLLVAEVNPQRRSSALNLLNFSWSAGAVACPFLVSAADRSHHVPSLLLMVAGFSLMVVIAIAFMPTSIAKPSYCSAAKKKFPVDWKHRSLPILLALFFLYVGTENGFGGWLATYATSLRIMPLAVAVMTPSFFYSSLMIGRWLAPFLLRRLDEIRLAKAGLVVACAGMAGLVGSHSFFAVAASATAAGLGLSSVYPITIALLSRDFGPAATRVGSLTFTTANIGGACLPWLVGLSSNHFGTLKAGLVVPLIGGAVMYVLYIGEWHSKPAKQSAERLKNFPS